MKRRSTRKSPQRGSSRGRHAAAASAAKSAKPKATSTRSAKAAKPMGSGRRDDETEPVGRESGRGSRGAAYEVDTGRVARVGPESIEGVDEREDDIERSLRAVDAEEEDETAITQRHPRMPMDDHEEEG